MMSSFLTAHQHKKKLFSAIQTPRAIAFTSSFVEGNKFATKQLSLLLCHSHRLPVYPSNAGNASKLTTVGSYGFYRLVSSANLVFFQFSYPRSLRNTPSEDFKRDGGTKTAKTIYWRPINHYGRQVYSYNRRLIENVIRAFDSYQFR